MNDGDLNRTGQSEADDALRALFLRADSQSDLAADATFTATVMAKVLEDRRRRLARTELVVRLAGGGAALVAAWLLPAAIPEVAAIFANLVQSPVDAAAIPAGATAGLGMLLAAAAAGFLAMGRARG